MSKITIAAIVDAINNYKQGGLGEPWGTLDDLHPVYLHGVGWMERVVIESLPLEYSFPNAYRDSDRNKKYRFNIEGHPETWEVDVNFNSWDGPIEFYVYEVKRTEKVVVVWERV